MRVKSGTQIPHDKSSPEKDRSFTVSDQIFTAPKAAGGLHLVATPIGNLGDITIRALQTLAGVDVIACEDTRITRRLTERYGISATLKQYHEHNAEQARPAILAQLERGVSIALVSDAGTPLISDPGYKLVREVYAAGFDVFTLPGPSSVLAALTLAGLPTDRFFYEGFLPPKQMARRNRLQELSQIDATLVMFESGQRITGTLADLALIMPEREAAICRELTKLHEDIRRATVAELADTADELETRGEFVVVVGPPSAGSNQLSDEAIDGMLTRIMAQGVSVKDAVAQVMQQSGRPRRDIYARALALSKLSRGTDADEGSA